MPALQEEVLPRIKDDHGLDIGNANIGDFPKILLGRLFGCHKRRIEGVADCLGCDALDIGNFPEILLGWLPG